MTLECVGERKTEVACAGAHAFHAIPPAAHLFGAAPHDAPRGWPTMRRAERDHFPAHFAQNFAAALTEAKVETLVG